MLLRENIMIELEKNELINVHKFNFQGLNIIRNLRYLTGIHLFRSFTNRNSLRYSYKMSK